MALIVGIDLGTTFSAIAKLDDIGRPEMVDIDGSNITPSVVEFISSDTFSVGKEAKIAIEAENENIAQEVKRHMGSKEKIYEFFEQQHSPTSVSALILKKLKEVTESKYGPIDSAVVTVPANFANEAREATQTAAEMAGLQVTHIINEPTAAALAYAFQSGKDLSGTFAIYDLGGGTFDCTIAKISGQDIDILTSEGVSKLGGKDFDEIIHQIVSDKYKAETGEDLPKEEFDSNKAEQHKITLSTKEKTKVKAAGEILSITREEFETASSNLIIQTEMAIDVALDRINLKPTDIAEVILVGGSTRMPSVAASIKKQFGKDPQLFGNPDQSVALGAAIYAAYKSDSKDLNPLQQQSISKLSLIEAAPHFFGTIVMAEDASGRMSPENSIIITKDVNIPCSITESYYTMSDNQTTVKCTVTQSSIAETDPQFVKTLWEGDLKIEGGRPAGQELKFTYSFTEGGKMRASFLDVGSGNTEELDLVVGVGERKELPADNIDIDQFKVE
ncbi:Hsp70 family protein [Gammaproteobacteria bacterium]|nr:Hsp70 family protein [Gammaproteobacteria bacterium]